MAWERYEGKSVQGIKVEGDKTVPPTRWWNHWWLVLFGWKTVVVLVTSDPNRTMGFGPGREPPMYVGYKPFNGPAMIQTTAVRDRFVAVRVGHEDCTFFAVDRSNHGEEIPLQNTQRLTLV